MPDRCRVIILILLLFTGIAASQPPEDQEAAEVAVPEDEASGEQPAQPETPKEVMRIEIKDGMMSIELEDADFGSVIQAVAGKAGFTIQGTSETFSKKLNTRFANIDTERGVMRLFTLVKESNYMIHYDTKGMISSIDVFGSSAVGGGAAPSAGQQITRQRPPNLQRPSVTRPAGGIPNFSSPRQRPVIPRPQQPPTQPPEEPEVVEEENVSEVPYIPPQPRPPAFPTRRR